MIKQFFNSLIYFTMFVTTHHILGCSDNSGNDPESKAMLSVKSMDIQNIYDILSEYPGLESLFTSGDMAISEFEDKLFNNFLGDTSTADTLIYIRDSLPNIINTGTSTMQIFSEEVQTEMGNKGILPDFLGAFSVFSEGIMDLDEQKKESLYLYFDELSKHDETSNSDRRIFDYMTDILSDIIEYLSLLEEEKVNPFMRVLIGEFMRMKSPEDGKLDFVDIDMLIEKFTMTAPESFVDIFKGLKLLLYDDEFKDTFAEAFNGFGNFLGDKKTFYLYKDFFIELYKNYNIESLGALVEQMWDEGPLIGDEVESMGISVYGSRESDGKMDYALQSLLLHPSIVSKTMETFYNFEKEGYGIDKTWDQFIEMMSRDPFCAPLKGSPKYGDGAFYKPNENVSYKNLSSLKAAIAMANRWNIPFTFTCPYLYEDEESKGAKQFMRMLIPGADTLLASPFLWTEIFEKAPDKFMGSGHPVTEKKGYGVMRNGTYVAPVCSGIYNAADVAVHIIGDSLYNGPYDNIYDNLNWLFYERKLYFTIDLVQLAPHIPLLKTLVSPFFALLGIKELPVTALKVEGAMSLVNTEVGELIEELPEAITLGMIQAGIPEIVVAPIANLFKEILPVGDHVENSSKIYLMSQDVRELATIGYSLAYYDEDAFHMDRLLDIRHPDNYCYFYDTRGYSFEKNADKANPMLNFGGAVCVASYLLYKDAVEGISLSLQSVPDAQLAAKEELGLIYPMGYLLNTLSPFSGIITEQPIYDVPDNKITPFIGCFEPLLMAEEYGFLNNLFKLMAVMGKPDLKTAREHVLKGLSKLVATISKDTRSTYTLAAEVLRIIDTAIDNEKRWDSFNVFIEGWGHLLSTTSTHEIVTDFVDFVDYIIRVDLTDEDYRLAAESVVDIFKNGTRKRILTRGFMHITNFFDELDKSQNWEDILETLNQAFNNDGVLSYVFKGLEKKPDMPWSQIMEDADRFLHSELMKSYEDGSFWKDVYHLMDFLSEAIVEKE